MQVKLELESRKQHNRLALEEDDATMRGRTRPSNNAWGGGASSQGTSGASGQFPPSSPSGPRQQPTGAMGSSFGDTWPSQLHAGLAPQGHLQDVSVMPGGFPQNSFFFQQRRGKLDFKNLSRVDLERVVEEVGGGRPSRWADELVWSSSWRMMVTTG